MSLTTLVSSSSICSLNISVWTARKRDKKTQDEVQLNKNAHSKRAASVHKNLFAECIQLDQIVAYSQNCRLWINSVTLPWSDNGERLLPMTSYMDIMAEVTAREAQFAKLVSIFLGVYKTAISQQAFSLGAMFDRSEYPDVTEVAKKFAFKFTVAPLPTSGDFRVDIQNETMQELKANYEKALQERTQAAVADAWQRVREQCERIRDRVTAVMEHDPTEVEEIPELDDAGNVVKLTIKKKRRPKLHESMLDSSLELCGLLSSLNVTNDPKLEEVRQELEKAIVHVDIDSLKESKEMQESVKTKMDAILGKLVW